MSERAHMVSDRGLYNTVDTKRAYELNGWVKIPKLLNDEEVTRIKCIIDEATAHENFKTKSIGARSDQSSLEYQRIMRIYRALWCVYPEVETLIRRVGPVVGQLNGWDQTRLWQDRVFIKPGREFENRPTNWHQDVNLPVDRRGWCTVWIAMVNIPKSRGPLMFLNGSHRLGSLGYIEQIKDNFDLSELLTEADWSVVNGCGSGAPLNPGDATVHTMLTLHRAGMNQDVEDRIVLAVSYMDARQLYTGVPNPVTDGLGLIVGKPFEHENFPLVG
jgi:hypothetical protein